MMFVPLPELMNHRPLKTVQDCIQALELFVAPKYKNETTSNILYTKSECFGVLRSFFEVRKLSPSLTPRELEQAVAIFMDEKLWIAQEETKKTIVAPDFDPAIWFSYPVSAQIRDVARLYLGLVKNFCHITAGVAGLLLTDIVRLSKYIAYVLGFSK